MIKVEELIGGRVRGIQEYAPEPMEETALRLGLPVGQLIKLDANENPYGPTQHALALLSGYSDYHRYPDALSRRLRQAIGEYIDVEPESVLVGNGSDELIDLILRLFRPGPDGGGIPRVIDCPPSFGMYRFYAATNDMRLVEVPRGPDFCLDIEGIKAATALCQESSNPGILFLASPNNPDGRVLPDAELERLLDLPLVIVLDEAYVEFSGGSRVGWVAERDNLIVLRTFSKWAGLAGLRVGYGVFPEVLMGALWRLKPPYNVNCAAQVAALATLQDIDEALDRVRRIIEERDRLLGKLREVAFLQVYDSAANYILCKVEGMTIGTVREAMEKRGILLRYLDRAGVQNCIRVSVGTPMQDEAVLMILRKLDRGGGTDDR